MSRETLLQIVVRQRIGQWRRDIRGRPCYV
jgi:hypothetical protein